MQEGIQNKKEKTQVTYEEALRRAKESTEGWNRLRVLTIEDYLGIMASNSKDIKIKEEVMDILKKQYATAEEYFNVCRKFDLLYGFNLEALAVAKFCKNNDLEITG